MKRTDIHRPAANIPAHYRYVLSYALASSTHPAFNLKAVSDLRASKPFASTGGMDKCSVCSAHFIEGDIWLHEPTGEYVHIGHICADKMGLLADRSMYELEMRRLKAATAAQVAKALNAEFNAKFLASHPGLEAALETDHYIVRDIKRRFEQYHSLSDRQIDLVFKLANEAATKEPEPEAGDAPSGRMTVTGEVLGTKSVESGFGYRIVHVSKMLVKLENFAKVWVTIPSNVDVEKGSKVQITATFEVSHDDPHFAFGRRPTVKVIA